MISTLQLNPVTCAIKRCIKPSQTNMTLAIKQAVAIMTILSATGFNTLYAANFPYNGGNTGTVIYSNPLDNEIDGMEGAVGRLVLPSEGNNSAIMDIEGIDLKIFNFNSGAQWGGAINLAAGTTLNINLNNNGSIIFQNNHSNQRGGAIANDGTITIGDRASFRENSAGGYGGAIFNQTGIITIGDGAIFSENMSTSGGAFDNQAVSNATIGDRASFIGNSATEAGGAIRNINNSTFLIGSGAFFIVNSAGISGGAIINSSGSILEFLTSNNSTTLFTGNIDASGANSIAFGNGDSTLNINTSPSSLSSNALFDMIDPMRAVIEGVLPPDTISINKNDDGVWALGGNNDFTLANRSHFNINSGALYLYAQDEVENTTTANITARGTDAVTTSTFVLGNNAALVAGGDNTIDLGTGTISIEDGATIRGGSASQSLGGINPDRIEQGGITSLTLNSDHNTRLNGVLQLAALDANDNFTLNAVMVDGSGVGSVIKTGAGTVVLNNNSSYSGNTNIQTGTLQVNGSLLSDVNVLDNGRLSGTGSVGSTVVDGTIAPGNSIGTININGNYIQNTGSTYQVDINPDGRSDLINVSGNATINGGVVDVIKEPGSYIIPTRYTILTAANGVTGSYDGLTQSMPFLNFLLAYDANNVYLDIVRSAINFAALVSTSNQVAKAIAVESLGMGNPVYNAVLNLNNATEAAQAFDALSGEAHASVLSAFTEDSRYVRNATLNHLDEALLAAPTPEMDKFGKNSVAAAPVSRNFWAHVYGAWGKMEGNRNAAEVSRSNKGFVIGADKHFGETVAGLLGGYSRSRIDVDNRRSRATSDDYSLGAYAGRNIDLWSAKIGAVYTWHQLDMHRNVVFANFFNALNSDYTGHTAQVFAEVDYDINLTRMMLKPFAGAAYVYSDSGSWTEHGGPAALRGDNSFDTFYTSLGVKQSMNIVKSESKDISETITLAWRHAYNDTTPTSRFQFVAGGAPFNIQGVPIAKDSLLVDAGFNLAMAPKNLSLRLAYIGQFASTVQDNGVTGRINWSFD